MLVTIRMRLAIASGKGGTGKTFVATNLHHIFLSKNHNTVLVDTAVECPNTLLFYELEEKGSEDLFEYRPIFHKDKCTFCGKCEEYCEYNAIFYVPEIKQIRLLDDLCHGCIACSIACKFGAIEDSEAEIGKTNFFEDKDSNTYIEGRMNEGRVASIPIIKSTIASANKLNYDYMLIDSSPGTSCPFIQTANRADHTILVAEPTPFGLSDLKQAVETLESMDLSAGVIINRYDIGDDELEKYLKSKNIPILGRIPYSEEIARHYSKGEIAAKHLEEARDEFLNIYKNIVELWK